MAAITIKKATRNAISEALDGPFTVADFDVICPEHSKGSGKDILKITFRAEPQYTFRVFESEDRSAADILLMRTIPKEHETIALYVEESPGEFKSREQRKVANFNECIGRIKAWSENIREELRATDFGFQELDEFRVEMEKKLNEHITDPDAHLTNEEVEELNTKIDSLLQQFSELVKQQKITAAEFKVIKEEFNVIKENAETFRKGTFVRTTCTKLKNIGIRLGSKLIQELIMHQAQILLHLPDK